MIHIARLTLYRPSGYTVNTVEFRKIVRAGALFLQKKKIEKKTGICKEKIVNQ